jgi:mannose-6-phosphate isomerase-like protein (cupin superfamily)
MLTTEPRANPQLHFLDNLARIHIEGADSRHAYAVVELTAPSGDMPPLHVHHRDDEGFYVLDGRLTLFVGERTIVLGAGECGVAPSGSPHTYRAEAEGTRWLVICSPAGFEEFVREVALAERDPAVLADISMRYGIEILGPPGTLPSDA